MGQNPLYDRDSLCAEVTPKEQELLIRLMEECGEVIQIASKVLRWGWSSRHPDGGPDNETNLVMEIFDIQDIVTRLSRKRSNSPAPQSSGRVCLEHRASEALNE